ncbi:hypothetical protein BDW59DRAFT_175000 [Aspergillus cavernicola]|uniref:Uncharacterized protein n=1 Tax=Aspergillus cavernicola TaxID=176166 RepID=A0ABR4HWI8_9EURO
MSMHQNYQETTRLTAFKTPPSLVTEPIATSSYTIPRPKLIDELIKRVECFRIIRVNAPPASGKTTLMNLMINSFARKVRDNVGSAGGWAGYLERETGANGHCWLVYPAFLFIDDAQQSYWDGELWAAFFKSIEPAVIPYVVLFTSYCLPNSGSPHLFEEKYVKVPMNFASEQQISLKANKITFGHLWRPVGLLLQKDEARRLVTQYASEVVSSPVALITRDLKSSLFQCSNGHIGVLISLVEDIQSLMRQKIIINRQMACESLFSDPLAFFKAMKGKCFTKGLPESKDLGESAIYHIFTTASDEHVFFVDSFCETDRGDSRRQAVEKTWRNGWLQAEYPETNFGDLSLVFATEIHRWGVKMEGRI